MRMSAPSPYRHSSPRRVRERGAISIVGAVVIVLLVGFAFAVAVPVASGLSSKQTTSSAADAAALAAAEKWRQSLEEAYGQLNGSDVIGLGAFMGSSPDAKLSALEARAAAAEFAAANGADLTSMTIDPMRLEVTVGVKARDAAIPGTGIYAEETASARVTLRSGICVNRGRIGIEIDASCATKAVEEALEDPLTPAVTSVKLSR